MPSRTKLFQLLPWQGGLNTSLDESMITPGQLTVADNMIMSTRTSKKKREGIKHNYDSITTGTAKLIGLHDFWFGSSSKTQRMLSVDDSLVIRSYNGATGTTVSQIGTAWSGTPTTASITTFNNQAIIGVSGANNTLKMYNGSGTAKDLGKVITGISAANPAIVTSAAHGLFTGDIIFVSGSNSGVTIDGARTVTRIDESTFSVPVNNSGAVGTTGSFTYANGSASTVPVASITREHLGRLITNDKNNLDRLHFSPVHDHTVWGGYGDSGALDIGVGDGDPYGIQAIFPTFKGDLFVAKKTKLYRIKGYSPETYSIELVSSGIGCISHNSVVMVDQDDIYFVSERGIHSLAATANYGDFEGAFLSADIQKTFNDDLSRTAFPKCWASYNSQINAVAYAFTSAGGTTNDSIYLYHVPSKAWCRWPNLSCVSLITSNDSDKKRFYLGTATSRVSKTFNGTNYDITAAAANAAISTSIKTGIIYPEGQFAGIGLKRFILYYKPEGTHSLTARVKIDQVSLSTDNSLTYTNIVSGDLLGSTFVLGTSALGYTAQFQALPRTIDGYGHGFKVEISQNGVDVAMEIQGFAVEYEALESAPEPN